MLGGEAIMDPEEDAPAYFSQLMVGSPGLHKLETFVLHYLELSGELLFMVVQKHTTSLRGLELIGTELSLELSWATTLQAIRAVYPSLSTARTANGRGDILEPGLR